MRLATLMSILTLTASHSYAQDAFHDLMEHSTNLTFVAVGRQGIVLAKVGDTPCFSTLYTGDKAFGTHNASWFGGAPSASQLQISLQEMTALISDLHEQDIFSNAQYRVLKQSDIEHPEPGCVHVPKCRRYWYEGSKSNLVSGAIALGYQRDDTIYYYLFNIEDRRAAIRLFEHLQTLLETNVDAHCAMGNVIWRLKQDASQQSVAGYPPQGVGSPEP